MDKVWYQDNFPIGMLISGETLKELAAKKLFDVVFSTVNGHVYVDDDLSGIDGIEDNETWIIGLNTNSGSIFFVQLFTENRVFIETRTKPEVKTPPPFDFSYAL